MVVCTATASGKSLCYNLPILEALAKDPRATALLHVPYQGARAGPAARPAGALRGRFRRSAPPMDIYDGDTAQWASWALILGSGIMSVTSTQPEQRSAEQCACR